MSPSPFWFRSFIALGGVLLAALVWNALPVAADPPAGEGAEKPAEAPPVTPDDKELPGLRKLAKDFDVWIDLKRKLVVVDGKICLNKGQLEVLACPAGTKEHEAIIALNTKARFVHAALLAVGAQPGSPVRFDPRYIPASGPEIEILILWKDADGTPHKVRAQEWIRNVKTQKAMTESWVFGGSGFSVDEETGQEYYHAEGGELICVSNFPTATLDLPIESTQANADLLYECFTEKIPPRGTPVRLVLIPKLPPKKPAP